MGVHKSTLVAACLSVTLIAWSAGSWIHIKADLAQYLIKRSWALTAPGTLHKPWPWADTWPVARITYGDEDLIVLAGAHGSALAFGPGHVDGSAMPGNEGVAVVAGHRDTHFSFLKRVKRGEHFQIQTPDGRWHTYVVRGIEIVNSDVAEGIDLSQDGFRLTLVTCFPFDAVTVGGPLRYVLELEKLGEDLVFPVDLNNQHREAPSGGEG